ncbi:phosphotransferase [Magnetococcales bacterium HHB-1]
MHKPPPESVLSALYHYFDDPALTWEVVHGRGRNSSVWKITRSTQSTQCFALKCYPTHQGGERLRREYDALRFLMAQGFENLPKPCYQNQEGCWALYHWIDGEPITKVQPFMLRQLKQFLVQLDHLSRDPKAQSLAHACDCGLADQSIWQQIDRRWRKLKRYGVRCCNLDSFLIDLEQVIAQYRMRSYASSSLSRQYQTLSPSDIGFHNALLAQQKTVFFLDLEYFGWDDPVKMVADIFWHPGSMLSRSNRENLIGDLMEIFSSRDPDFMVRLKRQRPLYGIIWCFILLNDFFPERWSKGRSKEAQASLLNCQLEKAAQILRNL